MLSSKGVQVLLLRGDGNLQPEDEIEEESEKRHKNKVQQSLFVNEEGTKWKSTQSVLPKRVPKNSSVR